MAEVFAAAKDTQAAWYKSSEEDQELWFRGNTKTTHNLLPGLLRPEIKQCKYDEYTLLKKFSHLGTPYLEQQVSNEWEWYFLAQHYGLPTRLLDWSESLLSGVYFALSEYRDTTTKQQHELQLANPSVHPVFDDDSPIIWMMDAGTLNLWSKGEDGIFSCDNDDIQDYCWHLVDCGSTTAEHPIAISPPRQSSRIVAQRGMFTLHGTDESPIEEICEANDPGDKIKLASIQLNSTNLSQIWQELELAGYGRMTLFPDLENVARHIKWVYQSIS